ncbi:MAG: biotin--[acetyl-CoA-carboxylase] ligase [Synechococcaceae cyanobacterium SM2_3_60]|nr:biotin--[acetyl-CoA-carboxylase] ligase [Synechococcaceae cyanobacterium SM2_3_60]
MGINHQPSPPLPPWLHWLPDCESTNTWAIANATTLQPGDWVWTDCQTAGRGQQGRHWYAPPGVLTASLVLADLPLAGGSVAFGQVVLGVLRQHMPNLAVKLKWPNDLVVGQRKLAGILCERRGRYTIAGLGLNYQADFRAYSRAQIGQPISLHECVSHVIAPLDLLTLIRAQALQGLVCAVTPDSDALWGQALTVQIATEAGAAVIGGVGQALMPKVG